MSWWSFPPEIVNDSGARLLTVGVFEEKGCCRLHAMAQTIGCELICELTLQTIAKLLGLAEDSEHERFVSNLAKE